MGQSGFFRISVFVALVAVLIVPLPVRADDDEATSIFTENGYELRRDERVFALFAALNVAGYDQGDQIRSKPFPRYTYHPLREKVRQALAASAGTVRGPIDQFLDAHPESVETYLGAALTLGTDEGFTATDQTPHNLDGLDHALAEFAAQAKVAKLSKSMADDYRELFKKLKRTVDGPFAKLRAAYHLNEEDAPNLVFVPNPLDRADDVLATRTPDGMHVVVFGLPAKGDLDVKPLLRAYSALLAQETTAAVAVKGIDDAVQQLRQRGTISSDVTAENMVRDSLRIAVEAKLWSKDAQGDVDAAYKRGLLYAPEYLKAIGEPASAFPAAKGSFASQVASRVDLRKVLQDPDKQVDAGP